MISTNIYGKNNFVYLSFLTTRTLCPSNLLRLNLRFKVWVWGVVCLRPRSESNSATTTHDHGRSLRESYVQYRLAIGWIFFKKKTPADRTSVVKTLHKNETSKALYHPSNKIHHSARPAKFSDPCREVRPLRPPFRMLPQVFFIHPPAVPCPSPALHLMDSSPSHPWLPHPHLNEPLLLVSSSLALNIWNRIFNLRLASHLCMPWRQRPLCLFKERCLHNAIVHCLDSGAKTVCICVRAPPLIHPSVT